MEVRLIHIGGPTVLIEVAGRGADRSDVRSTRSARYTATVQQAVKLCRLVRPRVAIPIHYEGWTPFRGEWEAIERDRAITRRRRPSTFLGEVTRVAAAGALARGSAPGVALIALIRGHLADDESAFGDRALHLLPAHGFLRVAKLSLGSPRAGHARLLHGRETGEMAAWPAPSLVVDPPAVVAGATSTGP
jgi:hypothetical protein